MLTFPNAKINIGLFVTEKRADGYHNLETIFYPVAVRDALEIIDARNGQPSLTVTGLSVAGDPEKNLAWKAYKILQDDFPGKVKPLSIWLHKVIPMGAGLGGGSSDAAFLLKMVNAYFNIGLDTPTLESYALRLGSDCPFFISNGAAFAAGRGEFLEPVRLDLSDYSLQLVYPDLHISTALAFAGITPAPPAFPLKNIVNLPLADWKNHIRNDFEKALFPQYGVLKEVKEQLYAAGALYASLSGTGSTVYGIFPKGKRAGITLETAFSEHYVQ